MECISNGLLEATVYPLFYARPGGNHGYGAGKDRAGLLEGVSGWRVGRHKRGPIPRLLPLLKHPALTALLYTFPTFARTKNYTLYFALSTRSPPGHRAVLQPPAGLGTGIGPSSLPIFKKRWPD